MCRERECLCMRDLADVLLLSSLMGKNEIKITVMHPEIFGHTLPAQQVVLGRLNAPSSSISKY